MKVKRFSTKVKDFSLTREERIQAAEKIIQPQCPRSGFSITIEHHLF